MTAGDVNDKINLKWPVPGSRHRQRNAFFLFSKRLNRAADQDLFCDLGGEHEYDLGHSPNCDYHGHRLFDYENVKTINKGRTLPHLMVVTGGGVLPRNLSLMLAAYQRSRTANGSVSGILSGLTA